MSLAHVPSHRHSIQQSLLHYDGSSVVLLAQTVWDNPTAAGEKLFDVTTSPVTHGLLTAGHPVVLRVSAGVQQIVTFDPTTSPATETVVFTGGGNGVTIAADGTIYFLNGNASPIRKLTYDPAAESYEESAVPTTFRAALLRMDPDGVLYAIEAGDFVAGTSFPLQSADKSSLDVRRIDPVTGAVSHYGSIKSSTVMHELDFDSAGTLWASLQPTKSGNYVTEVPAGGTAGKGGAITDGFTECFAAGPDGTLVLLDNVSINGGDGSADTMYLLTPSDAGGDTGGGGKGKGNGKKK